MGEDGQVDPVNALRRQSLEQDRLGEIAAPEAASVHQNHRSPLAASQQERLSLSHVEHDKRRFVIRRRGRADQYQRQSPQGPAETGHENAEPDGQRQRGGGVHAHRQGQPGAWRQMLRARRTAG